MKLLYALFPACLLIHSPANSSAFDYSQVSLSYISGEDKVTGKDYDGYELHLTYDINKFVPGLRIQLLEQDATGGGKIEGMLYTMGIGSYWNVSDGMDLHASLYGGQYDVDSPAAKLVDTSVIILTAGLRRQFTSYLDGQVYLASYQFNKDVNDQTRAGVSIEYTLPYSNIGFRGTYETHSDANQYYLGVVINF